MATSPQALREQLQAALQTMATGDLQASATLLLASFGYASPKTLTLPSEPQAFTKEIENLTGGSKQLHAEHASLANWQSAAFREMEIAKVPISNDCHCGLDPQSSGSIFMDAGSGPA